jgi:hypothetical protein
MAAKAWNHRRPEFYRNSASKHRHVWVWTRKVKGDWLHIDSVCGLCGSK